jgi:hypothetical protein
MVRDQLTNSSLKLNRAHHANLQAEIAQRATQIVRSSIRTSRPPQVN